MKITKEIREYVEDQLQRIFDTRRHAANARLNEAYMQNGAESALIEKEIQAEIKKLRDEANKKIADMYDKAGMVASSKCWSCYAPQLGIFSGSLILKKNEAKILKLQEEYEKYYYENYLKTARKILARLSAESSFTSIDEAIKSCID